MPREPSDSQFRLGVQSPPSLCRHSASISLWTGTTYPHKVLVSPVPAAAASIALNKVAQAALLDVSSLQLDRAGESQQHSLRARLHPPAARPASHTLRLSNASRTSADAHNWLVPNVTTAYLFSTRLSHGTCIQTTFYASFSTRSLVYFCNPNFSTFSPNMRSDGLELFCTPIHEMSNLYLS